MNGERKNAISIYEMLPPQLASTFRAGRENPVPASDWEEAILFGSTQDGAAILWGLSEFGELGLFYDKNHDRVAVRYKKFEQSMRAGLISYGFGLCVISL